MHPSCTCDSGAWWTCPLHAQTGRPMLATAFTKRQTDADADHDRDWYEEHDPQSLVDSIAEHNRP